MLTNEGRELLDRIYRRLSGCNAGAGRNFVSVPDLKAAYGIIENIVYTYGPIAAPPLSLVAVERAVVALNNVIDMRRHQSHILNNHPQPCRNLDFCVQREAVKARDGLLSLIRQYSKGEKTNV